MTTFAPVPPQPFAAPSRRRGRPVLAGIGVVLLTIAALAAVAAAGVIAAFGWGGSLDSGREPVSTRTAALVTDVASLENVHGIGGVTGWPTLRVSVTDEAGPGVFVGIGPADAVGEYVDGVSVDRVNELSLDPFDLTVTRVPGETVALPPPGEQNFWVASATGSSVAELSWPVQDGDYRLVVMNADGTPTVLSDVRFRLTLPNAVPLSLAVLAGSALVAASGVALLVPALRGRRDPR